MASAYGGVLSYAAAPYSYNETPRDRITQVLMGNPSAGLAAQPPQQIPPQQLNPPERPNAEFGALAPAPNTPVPPLGPAGGLNAPNILPHQRRY
jgi:hypothetical protein